MSETGGRISLKRKIYLDLKQRLIQCVYPPGSELNELILTAEYGVSRTPIRAALTRLLYEKIVSEDATGHIYVAKTTVKEVQDITAVRLALEPLALDGPGLTDDIIKSISSIYKAQKEVDLDAPEGLITFSKLDCDFHCVLAEISDNEVLKTDIKSLNSAMVRCNVLSGTLQFNVPEAIKEHHEILSYLKAGRRVFAKLALTDHINYVNRRMFKDE